MSFVLDMTNGICWSMVYIIAIFRGIKYRTWCLPRLAICQNLSWEFWMVLHRVQSGSASGPTFVVQFVWLLLDIGIMLTWLVFDRNNHNQVIKNVVLLVAVSTLMYALAFVAGLWKYLAFGINAIMSAAFVVRAYNDKSNWRSHPIAILKLIGTLAASILNGVVMRNPLVLWLGGICMILDCYYFGMLVKNSSIGGQNCERNGYQVN